MKGLKLKKILRIVCKYPITLLFTIVAYLLILIFILNSYYFLYNSRDIYISVICMRITMVISLFVSLYYFIRFFKRNYQRNIKVILVIGGFINIFGVLIARDFTSLSGNRNIILLPITLLSNFGIASVLYSNMKILQKTFIGEDSESNID